MSVSNDHASESVGVIQIVLLPRARGAVEVMPEVLLIGTHLITLSSLP